MSEEQRKLTPKQERFCQLYTTHWNATRAAKETGYSEKTAMEQGYQLLQNTSVKERIAALTEHALKEIGVSRERVLSEIADIAHSDASEAFDEMGGLKPFKEWPANLKKALAGLEVNEIFEGQGSQKTAIGLTKKVRFWDKNKALELLGKHLKLYADRVEHSGPDGKAIETKNISDLTDEQIDARIQALMTQKECGT